MHCTASTNYHTEFSSHVLHSPDLGCHPHLPSDNTRYPAGSTFSCRSFMFHRDIQEEEFQRAGVPSGRFSSEVSTKLPFNHTSPTSSPKIFVILYTGASARGLLRRSEGCPHRNVKRSRACRADAGCTITVRTLVMFRGLFSRKNKQGQD